MFRQAKFQIAEFQIRHRMIRNEVLHRIANVQKMSQDDAQDICDARCNLTQT